MTACVSAYVINDAFMKLLFSEIALFQAVFLRSIITVPPILIMVWITKVAIRNLSKQDKRLILVRVGAEIFITITFLTALKHMPLANVTAILQALPLAITMAAALFLAEPVGWRRWSAILVGFVGVLIVVRPGLEGFNIYSLSAFMAIIFLTVREISTRKLKSEVPTITVVLSTAVGSTLFAGIMMIGSEWDTVSAVSWLLILGAAVAILIATLLSVMAMRIGEIGFVSPFRYTSMLGAIGLGILIFGDWPDQPTLVGTVIIVSTGIYTFHREQKVSRKATTQ
ncbi:MAG: DMT family transporter [Candidatus Thioglobus sp.]|nr:DMT family transporter [Candidatus Pseudothioglobus aerophilus]MBT4245206.1 DMT family transporter [Gammaproteobacteria bacterium]MBT4973969.1 DMT family transporter [Gammaproteobacteria bacterium]MBT6634020.1 DMT family transporter [Gammaproteobacteria bacterium]MBT7389887.1 DMT family transporter [Gammaproteobacteria bacterium]